MQQAGSVVRICNAARQEGRDVSGTRFFMIGEPVTPAKHKAITDVGGVPIVSYSMAEAGQLGNSCSGSESADDLHAFSATEFVEALFTE